MNFHEFLICVATVNGPKRLEEFIKSVIAYTNDIDYKISITDDCSDLNYSEQNREIAIKYGCYYSRNDVRSGVPYSWNRAIEKANCKYLVIANDDVIVCPKWLNAYKEIWNSNTHLRLGVIAWPATNNLNDISKDSNQTVSIDYSHIETPIVACSGYLFAVTKTLATMVQNFDERYFATWEEIDFGAKLCMYGYKSIGLNGPVIYHEGGASFRDPINQHPAMIKQSLAQTQWIDKWSSILKINQNNKTHQQLIKEISDKLVSKIPSYKHDDFKSIEIKKEVYNE